MRYEFEFKDIRTQKTIIINTDSTNTVKEFLNDLHPLICIELNVCPQIAIIEIIEAGHYNNSNGWSPELADKLDVMYNPERKLEDIYKTSWKNTAFYIRMSKKT